MSQRGHGPGIRTYAEKIVSNAQVLAKALLEKGFDLVSGGTDNHLMLADLRPLHVTGKEFQTRLDDVHITVNKNAIPNDPEKPTVTSGRPHRYPCRHHPRPGRGGYEDHRRVHVQNGSGLPGNPRRGPGRCGRNCKKYPLYE